MLDPLTLGFIGFVYFKKYNDKKIKERKEIKVKNE